MKIKKMCLISFSSSLLYVATLMKGSLLKKKKKDLDMSSFWLPSSSRHVAMGTVSTL